MKKKKAFVLHTLSLAACLCMFAAMCNSTGPDNEQRGRQLGGESTDTTDGDTVGILRNSDLYLTDTTGEIMNNTMSDTAVLHTQTISEPEPVKNNEPASTDTTVELVAGFVRLGDGLSGSILQNGTQSTIPISTKVRTLTREQLIEFIKLNANLFSTEQLALLEKHRGFMQQGYESELFSALLGLAVANDTSYFLAENHFGTKLYKIGKSSLLNALHQLVENEYFLTGTVTAIGLSMVPARSAYFIPVVKLTFPDGVKIRAVSTKVFVADSSGNQSRVTGVPGEVPLNLEPLEKVSVLR